MASKKPFWKCLTDCWMKDASIRSFIKGKSYQQISSDGKPLSLRDEQGASHLISGWERHFSIS